MIDLIRNNLGLRPEQFDIVKAHRIGRRVRFSNNPNPSHRNIIVSFIDLRQANIVLSHANRLKGTFYGISHDYPTEIHEARRKLWPEYKRARDKYGPKNVTIKYPAALVINGDIVQDHFPEWHSILRGSRNSNVQDRIKEQVKVIATDMLKTSQHLNNQQSTIDESDSESDTSVMDTVQNNIAVDTTNVGPSSSTPQTKSDKTKRPAPNRPTTPSSPNRPGLPTMDHSVAKDANSLDSSNDKPPDQPLHATPV